MGHSNRLRPPTLQFLLVETGGVKLPSFDKTLYYKNTGSRQNRRGPNWHKFGAPVLLKRGHIQWISTRQTQSIWHGTHQRHIYLAPSARVLPPGPAAHVTVARDAMPDGAAAVRRGTAHRPRCTDPRTDAGCSVATRGARWATCVSAYYSYRCVSICVPGAAVGE